jgi:hypothetical protein
VVKVMSGNKKALSNTELYDIVRDLAEKAGKLKDFETEFPNRPEN